MADIFEINVKEAKQAIRKAQRRLRNAPDFMKEVAENKGLNKLTTRGNAENLLLNWKKAITINSTSEFTKLGFKTFKKNLAEDTRLNIETIDYALSQINTRTMDFINNSKLRYGSNPQLDYILDNTVEIANSLEIALDEVQSIFTQIPLDIF